MYLLDTNVISELRTGKQNPSKQVLLWASNQPSQLCYMSVISLYELEFGVQKLEARTPPEGKDLRQWLSGLVTFYRGRILPFEERMANPCAALHFPKTRPLRDAMIAATAKAHGFTVVTRDTQDFDNMGVTLINPFL